MKRTLIAACVAFGIVAFNASEAQAIAIQFDSTNVTGDVWKYTYSVTDFIFGSDQVLFIDFDSKLYSDLQDPAPAPNADWSTLTFGTNTPTPGIDGDLPPGSFIALPRVDKPSLADPFTVTFTWLGTGTPGSQHFDVFRVDGDFNVLEVSASGQTSPVPEPGTLGLMAIGIALAGRRARRRQRL
jgi:hypothetical protein